MKLIFCNVGWMKDYNGADAERPARGGAYNKNQVGHEACNFTEVDGAVYGYVRHSNIALERLGAQFGDDVTDGVTIVWIAGAEAGGTYVVGWYQNAQLYRHEQEQRRPSVKHKKIGIGAFRATAAVEDVVLLPEEERYQLKIPRGKGGVGQSNIWYADAKESRATRDMVFAYIRDRSRVIEDVDDGAAAAREGALRFRTHLVRERKSGIVQKKKDEVLKATNRLQCEACNFDFSVKYGTLSDNFCEVHHIVPLHEADGEVETKLEALAILCSNCHRIIHRTKPMMTVPALRAHIERLGQLDPD